jgi:hypothetical protein
VFLEPGAYYVSAGSNINYDGNRTERVTHSAGSFITGGLGPRVSVAEASYAECGGSCPTGVQRFSKEASRGLGWTLVFGPSVPVGWRGGQFGLGPLGGVFSGFQSNSFSSYAAFRCVRAPSGVAK